MDKKLVTIDKKWGIASYKNFQLVTSNLDGDEIHGALLKNGKRISESGWWRTTDIIRALEKAIYLHNYNLL